MVTIYGYWSIDNDDTAKKNRRITNIVEERRKRNLERCNNKKKRLDPPEKDRAGRQRDVKSLSRDIYKAITVTIPLILSARPSSQLREVCVAK